MDRVGEEEWKINVLVFDVQSWGEQTNFLARRKSANERYNMLLSMLPASEIMRVQWAGELHALREFRDREKDRLSHIINSYMQTVRASWGFSTVDGTTQ